MTIEPILARLRADDVAAATRLATEAVARGESHPLLHQLVASELWDQHRHADAVTQIQLGLGFNPNDVGMLANLGFNLLKLNRANEARQAFVASLRHGPAFPYSHYGLGVALEQLGDPEGAGRAFEAALAILPDHDDSHYGLAELAWRRGDSPEAARRVEAALQINPRHAAARILLSRIEIRADPAAAEARLRDLLERDEEGLVLSDAAIALGEVLDSVGRYEEAYLAVVQGKSRLAESYAHIFDAPGRETETAAVQRHRRDFERAFPEGWRGAPPPEDGDPPRRHGFLLGFMSSGTTLLENVLAGHPEIATLDERPTLAEAQAAFLPEGRLADAARLTPEAARDHRIAYWSRARAFGGDPGDGSLLIDKQPLATVALPLIAALFPDAKLLFSVRDPRDVVLSCYRRNFRMSAAVFELTDLRRAALLYDAVMSAAELYRARLPLDLLEVRYEDLVVDFEGTVRAVCGFLGVDASDRLEQFADTARSRSVRTASGPQVTQGLYADAIGRWRNYAFALEPILPILRPWIERFGYPAD